MKLTVLSDVPGCVYDVMNDLGVPTHLSGYNYIVYALKWVSDDIDRNYSVTKDLYPVIAKAFHTTPSRVERCIRHAVEVVFDRFYNLETVDKYFGNSLSFNKGKTTNSHFIATLAREVYKRRKESEDKESKDFDSSKLVDELSNLSNVYHKLGNTYYKVLCTAIHIETGEKMIVYQSDSDPNEFCVKPVELAKSVC